MEEAVKAVQNMSADLGGTEILMPLTHIYNQSCIPNQPRQVKAKTQWVFARIYCALKLDIRATSHFREVMQVQLDPLWCPVCVVWTLFAAPVFILEINHIFLTALYLCEKFDLFSTHCFTSSLPTHFIALSSSLSLLMERCITPKTLSTWSRKIQAPTGEVANIWNGPERHTVFWLCLCCAVFQVFLLWDWRGSQLCSHQWIG